jgi:hypothetical protein
MRALSSVCAINLIFKKVACFLGIVAAIFRPTCNCSDSIAMPKSLHLSCRH